MTNEPAGPDPDASRSLAARLRDRFGCDLDPRIDLGSQPRPGTPTPASSSSKPPSSSGGTDEVLHRLGERSGASSRYRVAGEIARGGMGAIHRVRDRDLRRDVALKVIHPGLAGDPRYARRFVNEARITAALGHPGVVPVHDLVLRPDGHASYTMRLVEGRRLGALIDAQATRADLEFILQCLARVCDTLAYAHSRGVVHCDLKPDNIMVGDFGEVYVMDWGCAHVVGDRSLVDDVPESEDSIVGTPRYMAPEQARGEQSRIDVRTDVFAVGAVLYRALAGRPPYEGPTAAALAAAQRGEFTPIDHLEGMPFKPPPMLTAIVNKAMSPDPLRRHASAADLAEDLRDFLRGGDWYAMQVFAPGCEIVSEGDWHDHLHPRTGFGARP